MLTRTRDLILSRFSRLAGLFVILSTWMQVSSLNGAGPNFTANAVTANQTSVGSALNNIAPLATGNLLSMTNSLAAESPNQQQTSLNQLSGQMFGSTQTIGIQGGDLFQQRIAIRLTSNGQFLTKAPSCETVESSDSTEDQSTKTYNVWMQGVGAGGVFKSDGNASQVRYSQGGAFYGFDLGVDETGSIGIAGGNSYAAFNDGWGGYGLVNSYQFGLYALKHNDIGYVLGSANYGYNDFESTRHISLPAADQSLNGHFAGNQLGAYAESGLKLHAGWIHFQPFIGIQYLYFAQQGFTETGGPAALNVSSSQANSLRTHLGGRLVLDQLKGPFGSLWTPFWQYRWISEFADNDRSFNASFNGSPSGSGFSASGTHLGRNYVTIGKGFEVQLTENWSLFGSVDVMTLGRVHTESGSLGAVFQW